MKRFDWRWLAVSSFLFVLTARAASRPQYGGTLRISMRAAPVLLDPATTAQPESIAERSVTMLIFDTLTSLDSGGRLRPSLASSWQSSNGQGWRIRVRNGVKFHDGTPMTVEDVVASLKAANPSWNVTESADSVLVGDDNSGPDLPAELALPRNAIAKRNPDGSLSGTGPFRIANWEPGKQLTLAANEDCWRGRPFLDQIDIEMGRSFRDQMTALELGKVDLIEAPPEQQHPMPTHTSEISSAPVELLALQFRTDPATPDEKILREALALSIERSSIRSVLLQGTGRPAASLLPNWMSGYTFVFSTDPDLVRARHDMEQVRSAHPQTIGYNSNHPMERLLAERIALNARDAGVSLQPTSSAAADLRVVRIPLASSDPWVALTNIADEAGLALPRMKADSVEDLYAAEQGLLSAQRVLPLFHLPVSYIAAETVRDWALRPDGSWAVENAWLETAAK
jgi:peptide/nickel transport system substrate-binding protein